MDKDKIINKAINIFSTIDPVSDVISPFDKTNICYPKSQLPYEKLKDCQVYIPEIDKAVPYPEYCEKYKK